jgi:hypothetical protein
VFLQGTGFISGKLFSGVYLTNQKLSLWQLLIAFTDIISEECSEMLFDKL